MKTEAIVTSKSGVNDKKDISLAFSVVVPIHNEAGILEQSLKAIVNECKSMGMPFEVLACENGSTDESPRLLDSLEQTCSQLRGTHLNKADFGEALKHGILHSKFDCIIVIDIELWSTKFVKSALNKLSTYDIVIGSKRLSESSDQRPWIRRIITYGFNMVLRIVFGLGASDTHGLKAFRLGAVRDLVPECVTDGFIFDTELVLRAERKGVKICEVPVELKEVRPHKTISLIKRVPSVIKNLARLHRSILNRKSDDK